MKAPDHCCISIRKNRTSNGLYSVFKINDNTFLSNITPELLTSFELVLSYPKMHPMAVDGLTTYEDEKDVQIFKTLF